MPVCRWKCDTLLWVDILRFGNWEKAKNWSKNDTRVTEAKVQLHPLVYLEVKLILMILPKNIFRPEKTKFWLISSQSRHRKLEFCMFLHVTLMRTSVNVCLKIGTDPVSLKFRFENIFCPFHCNLHKFQFTKILGNWSMFTKMIHQHFQWKNCLIHRK